jgi:outer membrane autotransporter protein
MKWRVQAVGALMAISLPAWSANPEFQAFLFDACVAPTGALAARCAQTPGSTGNVSSDSESSLNPSQTLSTGDSANSAARAASEHARDRAERAREGERDEAALQVGPFSLLINARGTFEEWDRRVDVDEERGLEADAWGAELGGDYRVNDRWVVGALAVWETSEAEFDKENAGVNFVPQESAGEMNVDRLGVVGFTSFDTSETSFLELSIGYLAAEHELTRNVVFQSSDRTIPQTNVRTSADVDGNELFASAHFGYLGQSGPWTFGPYAGLLYADSEVDSYREEDLTGSGLALAKSDYQQDSLLGTLGLRIARGFSVEAGVILPEVRVEYAHEFEHNTDASKTAFLLDAGNNVLVLEGEDPDSDYFTVGAGVVFVLPNGWMPYLDYQTTLGLDDFEQWQISAGLRREL